MKNVLLVDDERPFLLSVTDGLAAHAKEFQVVTALNGKEAVKVLDSTAVDLVVTDLRMPKMDGFELLAHMSSSYPAIPVIVMTAYGTPEIEERLRGMGDFQYLEKPLDLNVLTERIFDALEAGSTPDRIHGISLAAFLQLLEMENKTCTLTVRSRGQGGHLYFVKGVLIQAAVGEMKGEEAALNIVTWDDVAMEIQYTCTVKKSIELPLAEILMEGFRLKDEQESTKGKEAKMDVKKLKKIIEDLKADCGDGLLATDLWIAADGTVIVGHKSHPKAAALATRLREHISKALKDSKFPELDRYFLFHLKGELVVMNIAIGDYLWGMLLDEKKVQLGLVLNVVLPKTIKAFQEAVAA